LKFPFNNAKAAQMRRSGRPENDRAKLGKEGTAKEHGPKAGLFALQPYQAMGVSCT
jgi:hypothetical protein